MLNSDDMTHDDFERRRIAVGLAMQVSGVSWDNLIDVARDIEAYLSGAPRRSATIADFIAVKCP